MNAGLGVDGGAVSVLADRAWQPRASDPWQRALGLALAAHALLVVALSLSVNWHTAVKETVEAEMWAAIPQVAAPVVVLPPPPTPVEEAVEVPPEPVPPPEVPKVPAPPEPSKPAELAVAKPDPKPVKKPKARPPEEWVRPEPTPAKPKPRAKPAPELRPEPPVKPQKTRPTDKASPPADAKPSAAVEKARQDNLRRMMSELGDSALSSAGPGAEYAGRIKARIKPNVVFTETVSGNPLATVEVRSAPDGRIISRRVLKSSGVPAWDEAVVRAIDRTEVLPLDERGRIPPVIQMDFRPKDF